MHAHHLALKRIDVHFGAFQCRLATSTLGKSKLGKRGFSDMPRTVTQSQRWKRLLRQWQIGPASRLEAAREYTTDYPDESGGWIALADALWSLARYSEARGALQRAERLHPQKSRHQIWEQWGHFYRDKFDLRRAEWWYRKRLRAKPSTRAHIFLGAILARQGRLEEAKVQQLKAIRRATPDEPTDEAHLNVALLLRAQGQYEQAREHLLTALSIDPRYSDARTTLRDVEQVLKSRRATTNRVKNEH
jgi:tetratricopeptide (TPR) repeat protein